MTPTFLQRLDLSIRQSAPVAITLLVAILMVVPLPLPGYMELAPDLVLIAVFYWTVHRPDLMRAWAVFLIGLLQDILGGGPLGLIALVLILVHAAIINQHKAFRGKSFGLIWAGFMLIAPGAHIVAAVLAFIVADAHIELSTFGVRLVLTVAAYPAMAWLLGRAQRAFLASTADE